MNLDEQIMKIKSELSDEQLQKLMYYFSNYDIYELIELARIKCKTKFLYVMRRNTNKFLLFLDNNKNVARPETKNLLNQSRKTLKQVQKFIKSKDIIDANCLLRSAFENLIMGMMINENEDTYKEFINLSIDEKTRKFTKPQKLRNDFRNILRKLDGELFLDINNRFLKNMLDEMYDKMCLYTHSTLLVNAVSEMENNIDLYIFSLKQIEYFVEIILYLSLKYLCKAKNSTINNEHIYLGWIIIVIDATKNQNVRDIDKLKKALYAEHNKDYVETNKKSVEYFIKDVEKMKQDISDNFAIIIYSFIILLE